MCRSAVASSSRVFRPRAIISWNRSGDFRAVLALHCFRETAHPNQFSETRNVRLVVALNAEADRSRVEAIGCFENSDVAAGIETRIGNHSFPGDGDRGGQYAADLYRKALGDFGLRVSMVDAAIPMTMPSSRVL